LSTIENDIKILNTTIGLMINNTIIVDNAQSVSIQQLQSDVRALQQNLKDLLMNLDLMQSSIEDLQKSDRTNKVDYALALGGGYVVQGAHTETYKKPQPCPNGIIGYTRGALFGCYYPTKDINSMLSTNNDPGSCWAMTGSKGYAVIKLRESVIIDGFSFEHLSYSTSYDSTSAPKEIEFYGLTSALFNSTTKRSNGNGSVFAEELGDKLAVMNYQLTDSLPKIIPLLHENQKAYDYVKFQVLSNHNNTDYTCIYRIRVHGQPVDSNNNNNISQDEEKQIKNPIIPSQTILPLKK